MTNVKIWYVVSATEFYIRFAEAKNAHKKYLQKNAMDSSDKNEQLLNSKIAERNYIISSQMISQKLAASFVNFDLVCIAVGLFCLVSVNEYFYKFFSYSDLKLEFNFSFLFLLGIAKCDFLAAINKWAHKYFSQVFGHFWLIHKRSSFQYIEPIHFTVEHFDIPDVCDYSFHRSVEYSAFHKTDKRCRN